LLPGGFNPDRRRRTGGFDSDRRRPAGGFDPARKPPPAAIPLGIRPGLLLRDADNNLIIGRPDAQADAYWIAINSTGNVVGYLGFLRRLEINGDLDSLFSKRVENYLAWLLLGVLAITGLVAIPLAGGLVGSIEKLRIAFHQLASGNYQLSLEKQSNDEIGDLQEDFNRLARTMRKNLEARQLWIADISHELRTPIAVLQGEVEAIIDGVRDVDSASIKSLHQEILRLSRLLDDLHELSLSDLGAMSYHNKSIDICALLGSILERQRQTLAQDSISVELDTGEKPMYIFADEQRLEQLFTNLLNNSRFYTARPGLIKISLTRSENQVLLDWSDSAPGVADADLDRLFERLYRVDASRNRNTGGSGLGLSICKNIVEAAQGKIVAEHSSIGGLSIKISLPLVH